MDTTTLQSFLAGQEKKDLLRFLTCGSVDDGKSTLIGRLLYDSQLLFEDQLVSLQSDSARFGNAGADVDLALLVDGLEAEREQGITIDVAYRYFATEKRKFIVADTPGHEQYTRNMATGASTADLALLLVDARQGLLRQTRRHAYIASLLGIRHAVLAVNKMDLVDYSRERFDETAGAFRTLAADLGFESLAVIPVSAKLGDNVTRKSAAMGWYQGPTVLEHLETVPAGPRDAAPQLRFPVQWVNRPDADFRGYCGTLAGGRAFPGQQVAVAASGRVTTISRIVAHGGDRPEALAGEAVTLVLADEIDISRGDMLVDAASRPEVADQFAAHLIWMNDSALLPGRPYLLKIGPREIPASVTEIKYRVDVESFGHEAAKTLELNDIGVCNVSLAEPVAFDPYADNRQTGSFILIDRLTNLTVGAGMIDFALRRATNIHWQALDTGRQAKASLKGQQPVVLWFTGLSGSGKSTIANIVEKKLHARGRHTHLLDGDNVRHGLNRDLGFTDADRVENIRRVAEVARLFADAGLIALVSFISPFRSERRLARERMEPGEFVEVFIDTPIDVCAARDPKGLYAKAKAGQLKNFTGIDSPYEAPELAEIRLDTTMADAEELADIVIAWLEENGKI
ncbi:MAG: sulfate adenylyltransferase subunit CysN [Flavobacteriaceae bacterium]